MADDGNLMAVPLEAEGTNLRPGVSQVLFSTGHIDQGREAEAAFSACRLTDSNSSSGWPTHGTSQRRLSCCRIGWPLSRADRSFDNVRRPSVQRASSRPLLSPILGGDRREELLPAESLRCGRLSSAAGRPPP